MHDWLLRNLPVGFMVNNINDIQVFKIFKSYTDTTGQFTLPFITSLQDMDLEVKCLHTDQFIRIILPLFLSELTQNKQ